MRGERCIVMILALVILVISMIGLLKLKVIADNLVDQQRARDAEIMELLDNTN